MTRRLSCFPTSDETFCDAAEAALQGIDPAIDPSLIGQMLEELLTSAYPQVAVRQQSELGRFAEEDLWYVYRDGSLIGRETEREPASPAT